MNTPVRSSTIQFRDDSVIRTNLRPLNLLLQSAAKQFGDYTHHLADPVRREKLARECRALARDILLIDADNADALNLLARLALDDNNIQQARQLLIHALVKHPDNAGCHYSFGHVMLAEKQYTQAIESFEKAISLDGGQLRFYTSLAFSLLKRGRFDDAATIYRKLRSQLRDDAHINSQLLLCLQHASIPHYDSQLEADLVTYLEESQGDLQMLAAPVAKILTHKYLLDRSDSVVTYELVIADPLLLAALPRIRFENPAVENLLVAVRRNLLEVTLYTGSLGQAAEIFVKALAEHNIGNGYIHAQSLAEQTVLDEILQVMRTDFTSDASAKIDELFLLASMYQHPHDIAELCALHGDMPDWRDSARALWLRRDDGTAHTVMCPQDESLAERVHVQYEQSPYPLWQHLHYRTPTRYRDALLSELTGFRPPAFLQDEKLKILVAGCGTGKQAISIARYFVNVGVTAIDISNNSLRYASRMAAKHHADNIRFQQADITSLEMGEDFHIIECSGVLHHIPDEDMAMQRLLKHLRPDGLLKLGLYSERARAGVLYCRNMINRMGLSTSHQDVRDFRQLVLVQAQTDSSLQSIVMSGDFYSYDGCIDLLFNAYERYYSPASIAALLDRYQLRFLGFTGLNEHVRNTYLRRFAHNPDLTDLMQWEEFEMQHPGVFGGMFQFYVQRR